MKYNKSQKIIKNISASIGAIATGFLIGLFVYGLLLIPQTMPAVTSVAHAESLSAICSVTSVSSDTATWVATVSGGSGTVTYSWSGTDDLSDSTSTVTKTYTTSGTKTGTVVVTSGGSSSSAMCSIIITVSTPPGPTPLSASCSVSPDTATTRDTVTWTAVPTGGTGSYSYTWSGDDSLLGDTISTAKAYLSPGTKTGSVTVTSGAESVSPMCTNSVTVSGPVISPQCSDGADNDGDTLTDEDDPACHSDGDATNATSYTPDKDNENSIPVITLIGDVSISFTVGDSFADPSATATDEEDGDITADIVVAGDTVDTSTAGTYTITYNVSDSKGAAATEVTRTVVVNTPQVTPPPSNPPSGGGGGGGGGGTPIHLEISNEKVEKIATSTALVTWDTNLQANSQVFYDTTSHASSMLPFAEYATSTTKTNSLVTKHSVTITGLNLDSPYYFRPVAFRSIEEKGGIELTLKLDGKEEPTQPAVCSEYLLEHIRFGEDNSIVEVKKLQVFLNDFEGFSLDVTGTYDLPTFEAVEIFQEKYADDILTPWGIEGSTGYVYITTQKKINEIYCNKFISFSLDDITQEERIEVEQFRVLLESLRSRGIEVDTSKVGIRRTSPLSVDSSAIAEVETSNDLEDGLTVETDSTEEVSSFSDIASGESSEDGVAVISSNGSEASVISATESENGGVIKNFFRKINFGNFIRVLFRTIF